MKTALLIAAGFSAAAVIYIIVNSPAPQYATGSDDVEGAARKTSAWGSKKRIGSTGDSLAGKVKEGLGRLTGDSNLASEGEGDQVVGQVKDAVGSVAQAAGQTLHDLNR